MPRTAFLFKIMVNVKDIFCPFSFVLMELCLVEDITSNRHSTFLPTQYRVRTDSLWIQLALPANFFFTNNSKNVTQTTQHHQEEEPSWSCCSLYPSHFALRFSPLVAKMLHTLPSHDQPPSQLWRAITLHDLTGLWCDSVWSDLGHTSKTEISVLHP